MASKLVFLVMSALLLVMASFNTNAMNQEGYHGYAATNETLYEVYTEGGIINVNGSALIAEGPSFTLNGKDFHIFGGAIHYFRVAPEYWRDRIRKLKAVGCNTLETYVPWNLHEELPAQFNFNGSLDLRAYLQIAREEDLFVILRPGPYICAEWDFGGLPSWLLRSPDIKLRTSDPSYEAAIQRYYEKLIPLVKDLQFTYGGPIIAVQVENEYGSFEVDDQNYLLFLKQLMEDLGIIELFATSDSCDTDVCRQHGSLPGVLMTTNFQNNPDYELDRLERLQPDRPLMVMEFWTGWFDFWGGPHNTLDADSFEELVTEILNRNASLSFYMFNGGTNFRYMNGAHLDVGYLSIVTSYDYDAILTEAGDYTVKYNITKALIANYSKGRLWDVPLPSPPEETPKTAYGQFPITQSLSYDQVLSLVTPQQSDNVLPMELLDVYGDAGQSFGFIAYKTSIDIQEQGGVLTVVGRVRDFATIYLDNVAIATTNWNKKNFTVNLPSDQTGTRSLNILVENLGKVNFGTPIEFTLKAQAKGLYEPVVLDGNSLSNWEIYPLDFNATLLNQLPSASWNTYDQSNAVYPSLLRTTLTLDTEPTDTFINMSEWTKGIVIVNNFIVGRYWNIGPQQTLFIPAPLLNIGDNQIYIFEMEAGSGIAVFQDTPILG